MKIIKLVIEFIFKSIVYIYLFLSFLVISTLKKIRNSKSGIKVFNNANFKKFSIKINNYHHQCMSCGNPNANQRQTLIMMGGIPTDSSESMMWMAEEMVKKNSSLKIFIFHLPFYESYSEIITENKEAIFNSLSLPFNREISNKEIKLDSKFSHLNQSRIVAQMLKELDINKAHFVGHDRGVVVFEHLMIENSDLFLSFSRGSQVWDYYEKEWSNLAPNICIGPPHRFFTQPWQIKFLFNIITFFDFPLSIRSEGFLKKCRIAKKGSQIYDRYTHLTYSANLLSKKFLQKFRQTMLQTDSLIEIENRKNLPTDIKIMQFQGEDEFKLNSKKRLISDQPYFGIYNLFRNEIRDLYPECMSQNFSKFKDEYIENKENYKKVELVPGARMNFFALIPDSAHFNVIENPKGCAFAVNDFIQECNLQ